MWSVVDVAGHYAELQGALICYCAQPSVKSPRRPERPQIPLLRFYFYQRPSSLPSTRHPPWLPRARASVRRGWGERAGQLQRSAGAWCAHVCRAVRRGPGEFRAFRGGSRADRALLIERSWELAVTGHWGRPKLQPELICLQRVYAVKSSVIKRKSRGKKIMTTKTTKIWMAHWKRAIVCILCMPEVCIYIYIYANSASNSQPSNC